MINWLAGDDKLITIQPRPFNDSSLSIPASTPFLNWLVIQGVPTVILPLFLLVAG